MGERKAVLQKEIVVLLTIFVVFGGVNAQKMKLQDLQAITLHDHKMVASRRSSRPIPQLMCVGGNAGCQSYTPTTVLCKNEGWDGISVQWECKADMPTKYSFGEISVVCEGYDYPDDPYILKGSCSLEYTLEFSKHEYGTNSRSAKYKETGKKQDGFQWSTTYLLIGLVVLGYIIYTKLLSDDTRPTRTERPGGPDIGWNIPNSGGSDDSHKGFSPPPFGSSRGAYNQYGYGGYHAQQGLGGGGGGLLTGLAAGGVLGYLFGGRQSEPRASSHYSQRRGFQRINEPSEDDSNTMRTSTAYGGTQRR